MTVLPYTQFRPNSAALASRAPNAACASSSATANSTSAPPRKETAISAMCSGGACATEANSRPGMAVKNTKSVMPRTAAGSIRRSRKASAPIRMIEKTGATIPSRPLTGVPTPTAKAVGPEPQLLIWCSDSRDGADAYVAIGTLCARLVV